MWGCYDRMHTTRWRLVGVTELRVRTRGISHIVGDVDHGHRQKSTRVHLSGKFNVDDFLSMT